MKRALQFSFRHRIKVTVALLAITLLAATQLDKIEIDVSADNLTPTESPEWRAYEAARERFGSDNILGVYVGDRDLFTPEKLEVLAALNQRLIRLPFVESTDSLFTIPDIREVDGLLETSPLLQTLPKDQAAADAVREIAVRHPMMAGNIVSSNGRSILMNLYIRPDAGQQFGRDAMLDSIESAIADHEAQFEEVFAVGALPIQRMLLRQIVRDQWRILPLAIAILFVLLVLTSKSVSAGVIPLLNAGIASIWCIALMHLVDVPVNLLNYILPILILVIGAATDIHIIHEFRVALSKGVDPKQAVAQASERIWLAVALTGLTTLLGFLSTALSELPILRQFGIAAFWGLGVRFLISVLFLPAQIGLLAPFLKAYREVPEALSRGISRRLLEMTMSRIRWIIPIMLLLALGSLFLASRIQSNNDLLSFIGDDHPVRLQHDLVAEEMSGLKLIYVTLRSEPGHFNEPAALESVRRAEAAIGGLAGVDATFSIGPLLSRIHQQLKGGAPGDYAIPDSRAAIRQVLLFLRPDDYRSFLSGDQSEVNIMVRTNLGNSGDLNRLKRQIERIMDGFNLAGYKTEVTGQALLVAGAVESIVLTQVLSLGAMTLILFIVVGLLFLSVKCAVNAVCINLFSAVAVFGIMGLLGVPLNVGTCMVAAVTLGIVIDDTLHLLVQFSRNLKSVRNERRAMQRALRSEITPVTITSVGLAGGFLALGLSSFTPVQQFGLLSSAVIVIALLVDLVVTPMLFASQRIITLWDAIGLRLRQRLVSESPLFQGLTLWLARKLILASELRDFWAGDTIVRTGDLDRRMFMVLEGELQVVRPHANADELLAKLESGDVFGEVAFITEMPRSADVTALTKGRLLALDYPAVENLRRFSPFLCARLLINISKILGERFHETVDRYYKDRLE